MAFGLLSRMLSRRRLPEQLRYEDAREVLEGHRRAAKCELAARSDAPPETLYYLACDDDAEVRGLVAANPATPHHADELLRTDSDVEVREELARKIARLMPDMPRRERSVVERRTIALLEKIAEDEAPRVRAIVAREIAHCPNIPKRLAVRLAHDVEISVCGPILQYSPLLADEDLVELVATSRVQGAVDAIARRENLSARVSEAVIATLDISAVAQLLANSSADIRENSLESVIAPAAGIEAWHLPLVMRTELSMRAIRRIATFVSRALIDELGRVHNLDQETSTWLKARAQERIEKGKGAEKPPPGRDAIKEAYAAGRLNDEVVMDAATTSQKGAIILALSLLTGVDLARIEKIIDAQSGRGITAICWKAELSMRTALAIQTYIAHVSKDNVVLPRAGIDYPMEPAEMLWHLQYFGIEDEAG